MEYRGNSDFRILHSAFRISSKGQAVVELTGALVVILVLLAGLIHIGRLTRAHSRTMITARHAAALWAMAELYPLPLEARYLQNWNAGADQKPYTSDDLPVLGSVSAEQAPFTNARPDQLTAWAPGNALSRMGEAPGSMENYFLIRGYAEETVSNQPVIRTLISLQAHVTVASDVWLVWTEGIY